MPTKIFLIGLPGCGKSTIGEMLARSLQCDFVDIDTEIEKTSGQLIKEIFVAKGESGFRALESQCLQNLIDSKKYLVISTGGGIVTQEINRKILSNQKLVVYLKADVNIIYKRIKYNNSRPLLQGDNPLEKIKKLADERDRYYYELAKFNIDTAVYEPVAVCQSILKWLENKITQT